MSGNERRHSEKPRSSILRVQLNQDQQLELAPYEVRVLELP